MWQKAKRKYTCPWNQCYLPTESQLSSFSTGQALHNRRTAANIAADRPHHWGWAWQRSSQAWAILKATRTDKRWAHHVALRCQNRRPSLVTKTLYFKRCGNWLGEKLKGSLLKGSFDKACALTCRFLCRSPPHPPPHPPPPPSPFPFFSHRNPPPPRTRPRTPPPGTPIGTATPTPLRKLPCCC